MENEAGRIDGTRQASADDNMEPIVRELTRIFGDPAAASESVRGFAIVPLVSEVEAVAFLRSVPAGASWAEISELAAAFRADHPTPSVSDDESPHPRPHD